MPDALKAAIAAVLAQAAALAVAFGIVDSKVAGLCIAFSMALVNLGALLAHAWHAQTAVRASQPPPPPVTVTTTEVPH